MSPEAKFVHLFWRNIPILNCLGLLSLNLFFNLLPNTVGKDNDGYKMCSQLGISENTMNRLSGLRSLFYEVELAGSFSLGCSFIYALNKAGLLGKNR